MARLSEQARSARAPTDVATRRAAAPIRSSEARIRPISRSPSILQWRRKNSLQ